MVTTIAEFWTSLFTPQIEFTRFTRYASPPDSLYTMYRIYFTFCLFCLPSQQQIRSCIYEPKKQLPKNYVNYISLYGHLLAILLDFLDSILVIYYRYIFYLYNVNLIQTLYFGRHIIYCFNY